MTLKLAAVTNNERFTLPTNTAWTRLSADVEDEKGFCDVVKQDAISTMVNQQFESLMMEGLAQAEQYQIALIPLPKFMARSEVESPVFLDPHSIVVLPLTWKDLVTRFGSHAHPGRSRQNNDTIIFGAISVRLPSMEVTRSGNPVTVTPLEFKLLRYLILNPGRVISRDELLNEVWGFDNYPCTRTVDTHMWRLRHKLEGDPTSPVHFQTIHAMGYKFVP